MQIYLTKKNQNYSILQPLNLWIGGVRSIELKQKLGEPAILKIEVNRNLGQLWSILRDDVDNNTALRLIDSKSGIDIPFVRREDSQVDTVIGSSFEFVSFIKLLKNKKPYYNQNQNLTGSNYINISNLDSQVDWLLVGDDTDINYNTGSKNNFELLNELCKKVGWSYRENGYNSKGIPQILFGDFRRSTVSRIITNFNSFNIVDPVIINEPKRKNKTTSYKYNKIIGTLANSGSGATSIQLNASLIVDSYYPISTVYNGQNVASLYIEDYFQPVDGADYDTISIPLWQGATSQDLYNLAVLEITKRKSQYLYEFEICSPTFIQAGEKINIQYYSDTLPLFLTTTVRESQYDFGAGFCKILVSDEPTVTTEGRNIN